MSPTPTANGQVVDLVSGRRTCLPSFTKPCVKYSGNTMISALSAVCSTALRTSSRLCSRVGNGELE